MPMMWDVDVHVECGCVVLHQVARGESARDPDDYITVHPAQVPLLIQWLQQVAAEAEAQEAQAGGA